MKLWVKGTAVGAIVVLGASAFYTRGRTAEGAAPAAPETAVVERRALEVTAEAAGQVEPIRLVEVKSKASGEVLRLLVETGDVVRRGDLLAEVDPRDVRNALAQAEADLEVADARLATAEAQRRRAAELREASVITEQEFEAASLEEANARAQRVKAGTNLELARERMNDVTIRAPIDGVIIQKSIEVGQIIASASQNMSGGTTLLLMADLSTMQVRTLIDETDLGKIRPGQSARVEVEAFAGRPFSGQVTKIEPQAVVEQNVTMFPVLVQLDNPEGLLKPGMNAEVSVEVARRADAVAVPNAAVVAVRDAVAAGAVLGFDEQAMRGMMRNGRQGSAASQAADDNGQPAQPAVATAAAGAEDQQCTALRERVRAAGGRQGISDADRAALRDCFATRGGSSTRGPAGAGAAAQGDVRPGIVFVQTDAGPEPRMVMLGVNDWDFTEVVQGLEPGERVVLMSVARLQQQQQERLERFRERTSGVVPGAGRR
ncbi:MAG: efflux RND transporter periplasmic adaptor subunit [Longimicrobiales bacterium]